MLDYPASSGVVFASAERLSDCVNLDQEADVKKASVSGLKISGLKISFQGA